MHKGGRWGRELGYFGKSPWHVKCHPEKGSFSRTFSMVMVGNVRKHWNPCTGGWGEEGVLPTVTLHHGKQSNCSPKTGIPWLGLKHKQIVLFKPVRVCLTICSKFKRALFQLRVQCHWNYTPLQHSKHWIVGQWKLPFGSFCFVFEL